VSRININVGIKQISGEGKSKNTIIEEKKTYKKVEKSESMRKEIRSKKAQNLIEKTLKGVDSTYV
jgi:hypothetical protein